MTARRCPCGAELPRWLRFCSDECKAADRVEQPTPAVVIPFPVNRSTERKEGTR